MASCSSSADPFNLDGLVQQVKSFWGPIKMVSTTEEFEQAKEKKRKQLEEAKAKEELEKTKQKKEADEKITPKKKADEKIIDEYFKQSTRTNTWFPEEMAEQEANWPDPDAEFKFGFGRFGQKRKRRNGTRKRWNGPVQQREERQQFSPQRQTTSWESSQWEPENSRSRPLNSAATNLPSKMGTRRPWTRAPPMVPIKYNIPECDLVIKLPQSHEDVGLLRKIADQPTEHGYTCRNAGEAVRRFEARSLLRIDEVLEWETDPLEKEWGQSLQVCTKTVTVPAIEGATSVRFDGAGRTKQQARDDCDLAIVLELFDFDVVREASVELYQKQRKDLLDPTRLLDVKLLAWLDSSSDTFMRKMDEIAAHKSNFY